MTFTALCCEHSGFYQLQKVRALRELMQSHLCPAMDPILVQPHITRPLPPASAAHSPAPALHGQNHGMCSLLTLI